MRGGESIERRRQPLIGLEAARDHTGEIKILGIVGIKTLFQAVSLAHGPKNRPQPFAAVACALQVGLGLGREILMGQVVQRVLAYPLDVLPQVLEAFKIPDGGTTEFRDQLGDGVTTLCAGCIP